MSLSLAQFRDSVCISINDFSTKTRDRIDTLIPLSVQHIMDKATWTFRIRYDTLTTSSSNDYVQFSSDYDKAIVLWHDDYEKPIERIDPREYVRQLVADATPYGTEACKYIVTGGETLGTKQFRFLDKPTSAFTIKGFFAINVDASAIQSIPDSFYETIKSHVIYRLTPPTLESPGGVKVHNPSFITARRDYQSNLRELVGKEAVKPGMLGKVRLDAVAQRTYQYFHK